MTKQPALPVRWARYVNRYSEESSYWYQPKGLAITEESIRERLVPLAEFSGQEWRHCQSKYVKRLRDEGISGAKVKWSGGGAPLARMLKQVFVSLGLAWVDGEDRVEISDIGHAFLSENEGSQILSSQALRYQFWNPCIGSARTHGPASHSVLSAAFSHCRPSWYKQR